MVAGQALRRPHDRFVKQEDLAGRDAEAPDAVTLDATQQRLQELVADLGDHRIVRPIEAAGPERARELPERKRDDMLVDEARRIAPGAEGVTFLPYLQGERTPHRDASLRGAFTGLSLAHSRAHTTRAVLEGVCFALRDSLEILKELGLAPAALLLTGGGAKSAFIRQLQADGLSAGNDRNREEGGAYGAALLAAVGAGAFPDLKTAVQRTLTRGPPTRPQPGTHEAYEQAYKRFGERLASART
jgi:xylulokinase